MEKISCDVIKDLIPLYADGAVSGDTAALVAQHLETCAECRTVYEKTRRTVELPARTDAGPLRLIKKKLRRKRAAAIVVTALITAALVMGAAVYLYSPVIFRRGDPIPYLRAASALKDGVPFVKVEDRGDTCVYISRRGTCGELLDSIADGSGLAFSEQLGSVYVFSDGEKKLAVESEIYLSKYTVWDVPDFE